MKSGRFLQITLLWLTLAVPALAQDIARPEPEIATPAAPVSNAEYGQKFMVVTAHPEATQAGYAILKAGGTAADAAVAVQTVLGLVEPQSSGLGGGAFALYYDATSGNLVALDGRETAPMTAGEHLFTGLDGKPMEFEDAQLGGRSVGVPGSLRLLEKLHTDYGTLPWPGLFGMALDLAQDGFIVSPRLGAMLREDRGNLSSHAGARLYFMPDGISPVKTGDRLRNPDYAVTLRDVALKGVDSFYTGERAERIVETIRTAGKNPGLMTIEDLAGYQVKLRMPVCGMYRAYKVCSVGEPSSGGLTVIQILGMLNAFDIRGGGADNPYSWHILMEASRLAFADRNLYMADPDFVRTPGAALIDPTYLRARAALIRQDAVMSRADAGVPPGWNVPQAPDKQLGAPGTTHFTIADSYGNVLSMTSSIEAAFGSHLMVDGFLLNNQLTDFSFEPTKDGIAVANRVEGGKRPRSSMAPIIVFDPGGRPYLAIGSAGGSRIIGFVVQRIIALIDWDMRLQDALAAPSVLNRGPHVEVEPGAGTAIGAGLKSIGHPVRIEDMSSGLTAIQFKSGYMTGVADPRREGLALGE